MELSHSNFEKKYYCTFLVCFLGNSSFYAKAMSSLTRPTSSNYGFPFQSVVDNGNVYDSNKGIFTCPEAGIYVFAFAVEASHNRDFMVYFYRGGSKQSLIGVWPDASNGVNADTSSTLQMIRMSRGDTIYLYPSDSDGTLEPLHSTFSGWRIDNREYMSSWMYIVTNCFNPN